MIKRPSSVGGQVPSGVQTDGPPEGRDDWFLLTPMQTALVHEGVGVGRPWINLEQVVVHLQDTPIDAAALRDAWQTAATRHEALRLVLDWNATPPVQRCMATVAPDVALRECPDMSAAQQSDHLEHFLEEDRVAGVTLLDAPGWRVTLLRFDARTSVMVWTVHHALLDGRGMARILADVLSLLEHGTLSDEQNQQGSLRAHVEAIFSAEAVPQTATGFFKDYLEGFEEAGVLSLPQGTASAPKTGRNQLLTAHVPSGVHTQLQRQAKRLDATVASIAQTAWGWCLRGGVAVQTWHLVQCAAAGIPWMRLAIRPDALSTRFRFVCTWTRL